MANSTITKLIWMFTMLIICGCGTMPNGQKWGKDATITPGWDRVGKAVKDSATDPKVWVPLFGATVLALFDRDEDISQWAREHTPIFGSPRNAAQWSDDLEDLMANWLLVSAIATPSGDDPKEWTGSKVKGIAVELAAVETTKWSTSLIKNIRGKNRPNEVDRKSFPSGHTSKAFCRASLAMENIEVMNICRPAKLALHHGTLATAVLIGWGRIEGGWHYPVDVLAGAALGTFLANSVHDAFIGPDEYEIGLFIAPVSKGGYCAEVSIRF